MDRDPIERLVVVLKHFEHFNQSVDVRFFVEERRRTVTLLRLRRELLNGSVDHSHGFRLFKVREIHHDFGVRDVEYLVSPRIEHGNRQVFDCISVALLPVYDRRHRLKFDLLRFDPLHDLFGRNNVHVIFFELVGEVVFQEDAEFFCFQDVRRHADTLESGNRVVQNGIDDLFVRIVNDEIVERTSDRRFVVQHGIRPDPIVYDLYSCVILLL